MSAARHRLALVAGLGLSTAVAALAASPALAQAIATPAGDTGFWAAVNGWVAPVAVTWIGGAATWAVARFHRSSDVADRAALTADVRETATTGLFLAAHEMEVEIDRALPREKREELIVRGVDWVLQRLPGPLGHLGFAEPVVRGIVIKMLGQIIAGGATEGDTVLNMAPFPAVSELFGWGRGKPSPAQPAGPAETAAPPAAPADGLSAVETAIGGLAAGILPSPKA